MLIKASRIASSFYEELFPDVSSESAVLARHESKNVTNELFSTQSQAISSGPSGCQLVAALFL